jgi:hypothetical protein
MISRINRIERIGLVVVLALTMAGASENALAEDADRIQPYSKNPFYWQYKGKPVLLLGGSGQDNLFNHPDGLMSGGDERGRANPEFPPPQKLTLEEHLDLLVSVGGNYVRNTMSHRDEGNEFPYVRLANGKFDLDQPNPEYWERFDRFLKLTRERDIIVQIEMMDGWDHGPIVRHDSYVSASRVGWNNSPFNPANNVNYTAAESGLPTEWDRSWGDHPFWQTVLRNNKAVLPYQQAYFDRILEHSLDHPHVLYCLMNETNIRPHEAQVAWSDYWLRHIQQQAAKAGKPIQITEMIHFIYPDHPTYGPLLREMVNAPERYTFMEVSQINIQPDRLTTQEGYDNLITLWGWLRESGHPRPMNNTKIYGLDGGSHQFGKATEKFWRNLMAGCASARFHRPWSGGMGLFGPAMAHIKSARQFTDELNVFSMEPRNDLLSDRSENEAYLLAEPGKQYALYFPKDAGDGRVTLDLTEAKGRWTLKWLNILESQWGQEQTLEGGKKVQIKKPDDGHWAAVILPPE